MNQKRPSKRTNLPYPQPNANPPTQTHARPPGPLGPFRGRAIRSDADAQCDSLLAQCVRRVFESNVSMRVACMLRVARWPLRVACCWRASIAGAKSVRRFPQTPQARAAQGGHGAGTSVRQPCPAEITPSRERIRAAPSFALVAVAGVGLTSAQSRLGGHATLLAMSGVCNTACVARITGEETQGKGTAHQDGRAARDSATVHHTGRAWTLIASSSAASTWTCVRRGGVERGAKCRLSTSIKPQPSGTRPWSS